MEKDAKSGGVTVTAKDLLSEGEEVALTADLVVLVTGMVPRENEGLTKTLKLPVGQSGFYNEIHPKLRPVETVVDGAYICGACQSPKTSSEAVASGLAAVTQSAAILKRGYAELDPLVATVDADACTWCGACETTCPYDAIAKVEEGGKELAAISKTACKGCGGCVPVCPSDAIDLQGYTDAQIQLHDRRHAGGGVRMKSRRSEAFERGAEGAPLHERAAPPRLARARGHPRRALHEGRSSRRSNGPLTIPQIAEAVGKPSREVTFWVMGLRKYGWIAEIKEVDDDGYFPYTLVPREES